MPLPEELLEKVAARSRAAEERARRDTRRDVALTALACMLLSASGIALIGYAIHTTNEWVGRVCFWSGVATGNSGIIYALLAAHRRDDW
jgi:hypothetical protein